MLVNVAVAVYARDAAEKRTLACDDAEAGARTQWSDKRPGHRQTFRGNGA